jgi:hypothetical protein
MEKYIVIEGFGDFDTPANCWGVEVIGSFSCEAEANDMAVNTWENYLGNNEWKSYFVVVREGHELGILTGGK